MVRNVSKPTYIGSGHVLNSQLESEPCKQFCFCRKIDPENDNIILDTFLEILHQGSFIHVSRILALVNLRYIQVFTQHF